MACDAGSQHTVNGGNTVCWSALAILDNVSWHAEIMSADEFLSVLDSVPSEGEQMYCDLWCQDRIWPNWGGYKGAWALSPLICSDKWQIHGLYQCCNENSGREKMHNHRETPVGGRWEGGQYALGDNLFESFKRWCKKVLHANAVSKKCHMHIFKHLQ